MLALATSVQGAIPVAPGGSIQQALDLAAATPGPDTVVLSAGEYQENLLIVDANPVKLLGTGQVTIVSTDPTAHVIIAIGGQVTLQNLRVTGGDDGINATDCESLNLINVESSNNGDEGVDAENVLNLTAINPRIVNNGDHGIQLESNLETVVKIFHGTISANGGDGIKVAGAESVRVVNTQCIENDDGMDLDKVTSIEVRNGTCNENKDEGLEVDGAGSVLITASDFQGNKGEGIDADDVAQIALVSVDCKGNQGSGFQSVAEKTLAEQITITSSRFCGNGIDGVQLLQQLGTIATVRMNAVVTRENVKRGFNIVISGTVSQRGVISENNGLPDKLP